MWTRENLAAAAPLSRLSTFQAVWTVASLFLSYLLTERPILKCSDESFIDEEDDEEEAARSLQISSDVGGLPRLLVDQPAKGVAATGSSSKSDGIVDVCFG